MKRFFVGRLRQLAKEDGQALVLFAFGLVSMCGLTGMSVDVGRFLWARTQLQGAVDAAALAGAADMPYGTSQAGSQATLYWNKNNAALLAQTSNATFNVTYPPGNRAVKFDASADVNTWFARVFGINSWHVSASSTAASSVLDIAMVIDISGSLCWGNYPPLDKQSSTGSFGPYVGPGRTADQVRLTAPIAAGGADSINITVNSTASYNSTSSSSNSTRFGYYTSTRYYQYDPDGGASPSYSRRGLIKIDNEIFLITAIPNSTTLTVTRAQPDNFAGTATTKGSHATNAVLSAQRSDCLHAAPSTSGPFVPYDGMMSDAQYFTTLFNSTYDRIGFASYSSSGTNRTALTSTFSSVTSAITAIGNPGGGTNTAHGIAVGRQVLNGPGKRDNAVRVLVLLTDGRANSYCGSSYYASNYNTTSCPSSGGGHDGNSSAVTAANAEAARVHADNNTIVYTIGFGPYVDDAFLQAMADANGGEYFKAPTVADLQAAFASVAESTHIMLTQ